MEDQIHKILVYLKTILEKVDLILDKCEEIKDPLTVSLLLMLAMIVVLWVMAYFKIFR